MAIDPLALIEKKESGGKNVKNYKYGPGFSASGHYQIINETWRRWAKAAGIDISQYPRAIDAPKEVQRKVAEHGFKTEGFRPWEAVKHLRGQEANYSVQPAGVMDQNPVQNNPASSATAPTPYTPYSLASYAAHKGVDTSGFGGALNQGLGRAFADMPPELKASIYSGYRSKEHQQRLWDASDKSGHMVARPGSSQHGFGNAADLRFASPAAREWLHANAAKYGLAFPLAHEPWHVEAAGARPGGKPVNYALGIPGEAAQVASAAGASTPSPGLPTAPVVDPSSPEALTQAGIQQLSVLSGNPVTEPAAAPSVPLTEVPPTSVPPPVPEQTNAATLMANLIDRKREERGVPARLPPGFLESGIFG